jgi:hypothetical protein
MDSPVAGLENVAGRILGGLSALPTRGAGFGNLLNYMGQRERMMADPNSRAALVGSPFMAGLYQIGGGETPGAPTATPIVAPQDFIGPTIPTAAGPASGYTVAPGPSVWQPDLPPLTAAAQVQQLAQQRLLADISSPDPVRRGQAKIQAKIEPTRDEMDALISYAGQQRGAGGAGTTVVYTTPGERLTVGSPYAMAAMGPGEYATAGEAAAAAAARGGGYVVVPTGRGTFQIAEPGKEQPAGVSPLPPAGARVAAPSTTSTTLPTRANNPTAIMDSPFAQAQPGYVGSAPAAGGRHIAVFASPAAGAAAAGTLLQSPGYRGLTIDDGLQRWSGGAYGGQVAANVGLDPARTIGDLSPSELGILTGAIVTREGYGAPAPGRAAPVAPPPAGAPVVAVAPAPSPPPPVAAVPPPPQPTAPPPQPAAPAPQPAAAPPPPPPPPPPHELVRIAPDGTVVPITPPAPSAPAPAAPVAAPTAQVLAWAPPAPAEEGIRVLPPTALPWTPVPAGQPGPPLVPLAPRTGIAPTPAAVRPPGLPAGATTFTQSQPIKPEQGGGTLTVTGAVPGAPPKQSVSVRMPVEDRVFLAQMGVDTTNLTPGNLPPGVDELLVQHHLDIDRRKAEIAADVERTYGTIPEAAQEQLNKLYNFRGYVNDLLTTFKPDQRAQYVGLVTPTLRGFLQPAVNDPEYARFVALNAGLRSAVFAEGGRRPPTSAEMQVLGPILPSGHETSPAAYEAALRIATDKIDNMITGAGTLANMRKEDLTPAKQAAVIAQYASTPSGIHYGPYPWGQPAAPPTTTPVAPTTTTTSPFLVDRLYTLPPAQ